MRKVDHDSRRQEVAAAAARLIAEQGLDALTTRALAKSLGCSIGVLSHYFNNKDEIVLAAFYWADERIDLRIQEAMVAKELSIQSLMPLIWEGLPLTEESDLEWKVRFNLYTYAFTESSLRQAQREKLDQFRALMESLIRQLQASGEIRTDTDAKLITRIAFDMAVGAAQNLLMLPLEERVENVQELFPMLEQLRP